MKLRKSLVCILICAIMLTLTMSAYAAPETDTSVYIENIINYYRCYQTEASAEIQVWLDALERVDADQAAAWKEIMSSWQWIDQSMDISYDVLPEGLPQDDSLAIVVMGYALNPDGSMRQELYDRLGVALRSAQSYPNASVICTGGGTASDSNETEAGVMAQWLLEQGIAPQRLIVEDMSLTTTQNAQNTYALLLKEHPQITSLAVVTSDYHIYRSVLFFSAVSDYASNMNGTRDIDVVANACCWTTHPGREGNDLLADGLASIAGVTLDRRSKPALFVSHKKILWR